MWRTLNRLVRTWRHLRRIRRIAAVLVRHGLADVLRQLGIDYYFRRVLYVLRPRSAAPPERVAVDHPASVRRAFEELGPSFIKLGQILSTRPDLIGPRYLEEFGRFQDEVPPVPYADVRRVISEEGLDEAFRELVQEIEEEPLAAASVAQVHRARLRSGEQVVVKVQRPGVADLLRTDLDILVDLARFLERDEELRERYEPVKVVEEIARSVDRELDFHLEARTVDRFWRFFRDDPTVHVPKVYWELTGRRVLAMEYVEGIKVRPRAALVRAGLEPAAVARNGARAVLRQVLELGYYHADPHPGNLLVLPGNVVCFLDFGIVGSLHGEDRDQLVEMIAALVKRDADRMIRLAMETGQVSRRVDVRSLRLEIEDYLDRYWDVPLKRIRLSEAVSEFLDVAHRHRIRFPPNLVMLARAFMILEGVGRDLDPDFNLVRMARPHVLRAVRRRLSARRTARAVAKVGEDYTRLLRKLPTQIDDLLEALRRDRLQVGLRHQGLSNLVREMDRSMNRLAFGMLVASLVLGASLVTQAEIGTRWWGVSALGVVGYALATILAGVLLLAILRSNRL